MQNGSKPRRGCSKGKDCEYYHPPLCKNGLRSGKCKKDCKFHHIKGTLFVDEWPEIDQEMEHRQILISKPDSFNNKGKNHQKLTTRIKPKSATSYAQVAGRHIWQADKEQSTDGTMNSNIGQTSETVRNFQELREIIQQMQSQIQSMMSIHTPARTKQCPCRMNYH